VSRHALFRRALPGIVARVRIRPNVALAVRLARMANVATTAATRKGNTMNAQQIAQRAAEYMWTVATSDDHNVAAWNCDVYATAERALLAAIRLAYGLGATRAKYVRNLLAEYGPDDSLTGTTGRGIESYVQYVLAHRGEQFN
jgi:hypothetical protein